MAPLFSHKAMPTLRPHWSAACCDSRSAQWLRFRFYRGEQLLAFLPSGKIVWADPHGELLPNRPGHYLAASIEEHDRVAFARLVRAHRTARICRMEAFGRTRNGISHLSSFSGKRHKRLAFCCDPNAERFEIFGYDKYTCRYQDGRHEYYAYRHGEWYLLKWYGPFLMSTAMFEAAKRRAYDAAVNHDPTIMLSDPSPADMWNAGGGAVTKDELEEAYRRYGSMWNYGGS